MRRILFISAVLLVLPNVLFASSVVRTGESVSIATDQEVAGDFYGFANTANISGKVEEDLLLLSGTVTINGEVGADVAVVAGTVNLHGLVKDDVRIVAGTVEVAGEIEGDLVVIANELRVLSTAKIHGDVLFFGNIMEVSGIVGKDILGTSERLRIDSLIEGSVNVETRDLVLGERADVAGDVSYKSKNELVRAQGAKIGGSVIYGDSTKAVVSPIKTALVPFLIILFAALVWFLLFRKFMDGVVDGALTHVTRSFLVGFGVVFLIPISSTILLFSTLGSVLGIILVLTYLLLGLVSIIMAGVVAGSYFAKVLFKKSQVPTIISVVAGVAVVNICLYLPVVGGFIVLGIFLITIGSVAERFYVNLRS